MCVGDTHVHALVTWGTPILGSCLNDVTGVSLQGQLPPQFVSWAGLLASGVPQDTGQGAAIVGKAGCRAHVGGDGGQIASLFVLTSVRQPEALLFWKGFQKPPHLLCLAGLAQLGPRGKGV